MAYEAFLLPIVFGVCLVVTLLIYWIGGRVSAKGSSNSEGKKTSYSCGEDLPVGELRVDLEKFLVFAVYFLIFDVLAFVLATSFYTMGIAPVAYSLINLMAVVTLIISRRYK